MKTYLFSDDDFILISYLKSHTPKKVWWTPIEYIFDYENFYIALEIYCCEKNPISFNNYGYIMSIKFEKVNEKYTNFDGCKMLAENRKISNIYIVRTILYFHDFRLPEYKENINYNYFGDFLTNPKNKLEKYIMPECINMVDVGILVKIENDFIEAFVKENDDDFQTYEENYLLKDFDFVFLPKEYEFIKFE